MVKTAKITRLEDRLFGFFNKQNSFDFGGAFDSALFLTRNLFLSAGLYAAISAITFCSPYFAPKIAFADTQRGNVASAVRMPISLETYGIPLKKSEPVSAIPIAKAPAKIAPKVQVLKGGYIATMADLAQKKPAVYAVICDVADSIGAQRTHLAAVVKKESDFVPSIVGRTSPDVGLFQFNVGTLRTLFGFSGTDQEIISRIQNMPPKQQGELAKRYFAIYKQKKGLPMSAPLSLRDVAAIIHRPARFLDGLLDPALANYTRLVERNYASLTQNTSVGSEIASIDSRGVGRYQLPDGRVLTSAEQIKPAQMQTTLQQKPKPAVASIQQKPKPASVKTSPTQAQSKQTLQAQSAFLQTPPQASLAQASLDPDYVRNLLGAQKTTQQIEPKSAGQIYSRTNPKNTMYSGKALDLGVMSYFGFVADNRRRQPIAEAKTTQPKDAPPKKGYVVSWVSPAILPKEEDGSDLLPRRKLMTPKDKARLRNKYPQLDSPQIDPATRSLPTLVELAHSKSPTNSDSTTQLTPVSNYLALPQKMTQLPTQKEKSATSSAKVVPISTHLPAVQHTQKELDKTPQIQDSNSSRQIDYEVPRGLVLSSLTFPKALKASPKGTCEPLSQINAAQNYSSSAMPKVVSIFSNSANQTPDSLEQVLAQIDAEEKTKSVSDLLQQRARSTLVADNSQTILKPTYAQQKNSGAAYDSSPSISQINKRRNAAKDPLSEEFDLSSVISGSNTNSTNPTRVSNARRRKNHILTQYVHENSKRGSAARLGTVYTQLTESDVAKRALWSGIKSQRTLERFALALYGKQFDVSRSIVVDESKMLANYLSRNNIYSFANKVQYSKAA